MVSIAGLFAGIGGFELAFERQGFVTRQMVEIDPSAREILGRHFPKVILQDDVTTVSALSEGTDVVTAGFPCQNLSMAGDKSGIAGAKSGSVRSLFALIHAARVPIIVLENVYFMLQLDGGKGMEWLVQQFEDLGYRWAYRVLDSIYFGLPQRRRRVYLVATLDRDPRNVLFADETVATVDNKPVKGLPLGFYWTEGRSGVGFTVDAIPPLKVGSGLGIPSAPAVLFPDGDVLMPSLTACEQAQGFPAGWTSELASNERDRWRLIGNAVAVPVAQWVAGRIREPGDVLDFDTRPLVHAAGKRWPNAAWNVTGNRVAVEASDAPIDLPRPSIRVFRDAEWKPLSLRALSGFIARADEGGLRMPDWFLGALRSAKADRVRAAQVTAE